VTTLTAVARDEKCAFSKITAINTEYSPNNLKITLKDKIIGLKIKRIQVICA
jgi:hypothetical protein